MLLGYLSDTYGRKVTKLPVDFVDQTEVLQSHPATRMMVLSDIVFMCSLY